MSDQTRNPLHDAARDMEVRLAFYTVALAFGLLGGAMQTSDLSGPLFAWIFEYIGWLLLLVSSGFGLARAKYAPEAFRLIAGQALNTGADSKSKFRFILRSNVRDRVAFFNSIHIWALCLGVLSLFVARSIVGFAASPGNPVSP